MEMRMEQQPHHRQAPAPTRQTTVTMQARQRQDEVAQWERDWRETVTKSLADTTKIANDTAGIVREMQNDVKELFAWRSDLERRRDDRDDKRPDRDTAKTVMLVAVCGIALQLLSYLIGGAILVATHWK